MNLALAVEENGKRTHGKNFLKNFTVAETFISVSRVVSSFFTRFFVLFVVLKLIFIGIERFSMASEKKTQLVNFALLVENHDVSYSWEIFDAVVAWFFKDFLPLLDATLVKEDVKEGEADSISIKKVIEADGKLKHHLKTHTYRHYCVLRLNTPSTVAAAFQKAIANTGMIQVLQAQPPIWCMAHSLRTDNVMVVELKLFKP